MSSPSFHVRCSDRPRTGKYLYIGRGLCEMMGYPKEIMLVNKEGYLMVGPLEGGRVLSGKEGGAARAFIPVPEAELLGIVEGEYAPFVTSSPNWFILRPMPIRPV